MKGKVVYVAPNKKATIKEIDFDLKSLQSIVDGFVEAIYPFEDKIALICNEEGKIKQMDANRVLRNNEGQVFDIIFGPFIIVGLSEKSFCGLNEEQLTFYKNLFLYPEEIYMLNGKEIIIFPSEINDDNNE